MLFCYFVTLLFLFITEQTSEKIEAGTGVNYLMDNISGTGQPCFPGMPENIIIKQEPLDTSTSVSEETKSPYLSNFRPSSEISKLESPNLSTMNRPLFNSTPIAGSALFEASPSTEKPPKKPVKNYDVNTKRKPRYICNFCQYGTENYKTIHNHMYRHEPLKYLCPYCGFKRAPRYVFIKILNCAKRYYVSSLCTLRRQSKP